MFTGELKQLEKTVTVSDYKREFKLDLKNMESSVGSRYAKWENGKRLVYCPKCYNYLPEDDFNESNETGTGKKLWCKKHELKITAVESTINERTKLTQEMCMSMPEVNSRSCDAARRKVKQVEEMIKAKADDILTPFDLNFRGLFVEKEGILYNF